jgi:hypothetical protein
MNAGDIDMQALRERFAAAEASMPAHIREAHRFSSGHREAIAASDLCGCFHCLATFEPSEIRRWLESEDAALCPRCGIDSVLPDTAGFPISPEFLAQMQFHWFESSPCQYKS